MSIPKHICVFPWLGLTIDTQTNLHICCHSWGKVSLGSLQDQDVSNLFTHPRRLEMQQKMLNGEQVSECSECMFLEQNGMKSFRHIANSIHNKHLQQILNNEWDSSKSLRYLDLRPSNTCNFSCRTCDPNSSSKWNEEVKKHKLEIPMAPQVEWSANKWNDLLSELNHVTEIYFAGGEPLLQDKHYEILHYLIDKKIRPRLVYDSNGSILEFKNNKIIELWQHFDVITYTVSLDGIGKHGEYIRKGTDFDELIQNIQSIQVCAPHVNLKFIITVSWLNVLHILDVYSFLEDHPTLSKCSIDVNIVRRPQHYSIQALPKIAKTEIVRQYQKYLKDVFPKIEPSKGAKLAASLNLIKSFMLENDLEIDFQSRNSLIDNVRSESFSHLFPETAALFSTSSPK